MRYTDLDDIGIRSMTNKFQENRRKVNKLAQKRYKKFKKSKRIFLCPQATADSYIKWTVENDGVYTDGTLKMTDCDRAIHLDFGTYGYKPLKAIKKIDKILSELTTFRQALMDALEVQKFNKEVYDKAKKEVNEAPSDS